MPRTSDPFWFHQCWISCFVFSKWGALLGLKPRAEQIAPPKNLNPFSLMQWQKRNNITSNETAALLGNNCTVPLCYLNETVAVSYHPHAHQLNVKKCRASA
jgi:hypothetical protein